jgi:hypothetical protein
MNVLEYARVTDLCRRFADRLEDDVLESIPLLDERNRPDLSNLVVANSQPPLRYVFSSSGPPDAPCPCQADAVLTSKSPAYGGYQLCRTWRQPLEQAPDRAKWVYLLLVADDANELGAHSGLSGHLGIDLGEKWPIEVVKEDTVLRPYQAAALADSQLIASLTPAHQSR